MNDMQKMAMELLTGVPDDIYGFTWTREVCKVLRALAAQPAEPVAQDVLRMQTLRDLQWHGTARLNLCRLTDGDRWMPVHPENVDTELDAAMCAAPPQAQQVMGGSDHAPVTGTIDLDAGLGTRSPSASSHPQPQDAINACVDRARDRLQRISDVVQPQDAAPQQRCQMSGVWDEYRDGWRLVADDGEIVGTACYSYLGAGGYIAEPPGKRYATLGHAQAAVEKATGVTS